MAVNNPTVGNDQDAPEMPLSTVTVSEREIQQQCAEVNQSNEIAQHQAVASSGGTPDEDGDDDDDDDEGDMPWWLWLLLVAGVAMVVSWLRR